MKKIIRLFSLLAIVMCLVTFTSCTSNKNYKEISLEKDKFGNCKDVSQVVEILENNNDYDSEKEMVLGLLYQDKNKLNETVLYVNGEFPKYILDSAEVIIVSKSENTNVTLPKLPTGLSIGSNFAGWFSDQNHSTRITSINPSDANTNAVYAKYMGYGESGLIALVCITIVFLMLALLWGITSLFRFITPKKKENKVVNEDTLPLQKENKPFTMDDITDEDMMVAALVATIDYHNEIKEDVRVVSIKEIR